MVRGDIKGRKEIIIGVGIWGEEMFFGDEVIKKEI